MKKKLLLPLISLVGVFTLAGCGSKSANATQSSESTKVTIVGSTALQPLVEQAAEKYQDKNPNMQITVQGGGSGAGLSQVSDGSVTVGNSDIFAEEKDGVDAKKLVDHKVAVVGIAPVANKDVGVTNLTQQQLIDIFTKKITNWKDVGGKDENIVLINRAQGSGTRATFESLALNGQKSATASEQDSSGTVQKMVQKTPGAISYLAFSYLNDDVQALDIDGVQPTEDNVKINKWKIWSYEHMYTKGAPSANVAKFIKYIQGSSIQDSLVNKLGYISISSMKVERTADGQVNDVKP
ncbi:phosphate ABC transporter substrate-binding protein PstS family protein [Agrilactobacillus yilanensis]|uniref:Phosphate-binding protein n=1 Tax=Agrilactobacillus yilanensis TaxID=2485997 RepID=A0ABW4J911_9LACO|nr:phosphate ABC transporter substrate-binding protein PstS family protein [Agrilactobacillus yilanensis]